MKVQFVRGTLLNYYPVLVWSMWETSELKTTIAPIIDAEICSCRPTKINFYNFDEYSQRKIYILKIPFRFNIFFKTFKSVSLWFFKQIN